MARGDISVAVVQLKSALQTKPNDAELRLLLGSALLEQGQPAAALLELEKARDAGSTNDVLTSKLARALLGSGKSNEVIAQFGQVNLSGPAAQAELRTVIALAHLQQGRFNAARGEVDRALMADPKFPWGLLTRARLLAGEGKFDEAMLAVESAMLQDRPNGDANMLKAAILRLGRQDQQGAVQALRAAAADPKTELLSRASLVQVHYAQRDLKAAREELAQLQRSHPKHPVTAYMTGVVSYGEKNFEAAEAASDQLLRLFPDSPQVLILGGASSLGRGALLAAETKLGRVVQTVDGLPVARRLLAETYVRMGQPEKALATLRPLIEGPLGDAEAMTVAGNAFLQAGRIAEAEESFQRAVKARPDQTEARTALAIAQLSKGDTIGGLNALDAIASKAENDAADLALIGAALRAGDHPRALSAVERLQRKQPGSPQPHHLRGVVLRAKGEREGARASFESALKAQSDFPAATAALVAMDVADLKVDSARRRLDEAMARNAANPLLWLQKFELTGLQGEAAGRRLQLLDDAIKAVPGDARLRVTKMALLDKLGRAKDAAAFGAASMASMPNDPAVVEAAGRALAAAGDDQQAMSAFNRLTSLVPRSALPYTRLAEIHAKRGDQGARLSSLLRAIDLSPHAVDLHAALVGTVRSSRNDAPVMAVARELQRKYPAAGSGFMLEGDVWQAQRKWSDAMSAYRKALIRPEYSGFASVRLYAAMIAAGDVQAAEVFASERLRSKPDDVSLLETLATRALLDKRHSDAERMYTALVKLRPDDPSALNNLAWLMAERGAAGSVVMGERANAAAPGSPAVLDTLAKALAAEGQHERAIATLRLAATVAPERQEYRLNLVKLYLKAGQGDQARSELQALEALGERMRHRPEVLELRRQAGG